MKQIISTKGTVASEYRLLGATSACSPGLSDWECVDMTSFTESFSENTHIYCGLGSRRRIHATIKNAPTENTLSIRAPQGIADMVIRQLAKSECYTLIQRVHCTGAGEAFRHVAFSNLNPEGSLTAVGVGATDNAQIKTASANWSNLVQWPNPSDSVPWYKDTNGGKYDQAPIGVVDGSNTRFVLDPIPFTPADSPFGFPVEVYVNEVRLPPEDYTLVNGVITFDDAPECPDPGDADPYIRVVWYTKEHLVYGLEPVAVKICDEPGCYGGNCGGSCSDGCKNILVAFNTSIAASPDACGVRQGFWGALAHYQAVPIDSVEEIRFVDVDILDYTGIVNIHDIVCDETGKTYIAAENGLFEGCSDGFVPMAVPFPSNTYPRKLAYSELENIVYVLFGRNGIARQREGTGLGWVIIHPTNADLPQFVDISAEGTVVSAGGDDFVLTSRNGGKTWNNITMREPGHSIVSLSVGVAHELARLGTTYVLTTDTKTTVLWAITGDDNLVNKRKQFNIPVVTRGQVVVSVDDWFVYVSIDGRVYRNTNYGLTRCDAWSEIRNIHAVANSIMVSCDYDPSKVFQLGMGCVVARNDSYVLDVIALAPLDVLTNDVVCTTGCTLDISSVALIEPPRFGTAVVQNTGVINYTPTGGDGAIDWFTYQVTDTCGGEHIAGVRVEVNLPL